MPATVTLTENGHILHFIFHDPVTFEEIRAVEQQADSWYDDANWKLHSLMDVRDLHRIPDGFLKLRHTKGLTHPNAGNTAILGASSYIQTIAETIFRLTRNTRTRFFKENQANEADAYLRQEIAIEEPTFNTHLA